MRTYSYASYPLLSRQPASVSWRIDLDGLCIQQHPSAPADQHSPTNPDQRATDEHAQASPDQCAASEHAQLDPKHHLAMGECYESND